MSSNIKSKFLNRMFRRIGGVVWDMTSGSQGLKINDEIYSLQLTPGTPAVLDATGAVVTPATETEFHTSVNPFGDLGMALPAFATQVPFDDVSLGDIVVGANKILGWCVGKTGAALKVVEHNGTCKTIVPPKVAILGNDGVLVVQNLFSLTGGAAGAGNFANSLLPLLMLGGGDEKLEKMLPLLLMQSAQGGAPAGGAGGMNPMLMMAMMGGLGGKKSGDGGIDPMMLLAMSGGLGGGAGGGAMNPMVMMAMMGGDLFGSAALEADQPEVPPLRPLTPPPLRPLR